MYLHFKALVLHSRKLILIKVLPTSLKMGGRSRSRSDDSKSPSPAPKRVVMEDGEDRDDRRREDDRRQRHVSGGSEKDRHDRERDRERDTQQDSREGKISNANSSLKANSARSRTRSPRNSNRRSRREGNGESDGEGSFRARTRSKSGSPQDERNAKRQRTRSPSPRIKREKDDERDKKDDRDHDRKRTKSRSRSPERRRKSPSRSRSRSPRERRRSRSRSSSPRRGGGGRHMDRGNDEDGYRLHVADLDVGANKKDLEKVFGKYGPLKEIWMARSVPCFAFVVYRYKDDAEDAARKCDGIEVCGRRVRVTVARPRTKGMGRRGFDPSMRCYQCGDRGHFSRDCPDSKYGYKRPPSPRRGGGGRYYPENRDRDRFDDRRFDDRRY